MQAKGRPLDVTKCMQGEMCVMDMHARVSPYRAQAAEEAIMYLYREAIENYLGVGMFHDDDDFICHECKCWVLVTK